MKGAKYKFLGMYGESPSRWMGGKAWGAFAKFLDAGGTWSPWGAGASERPGDGATVEASASTSRDSTRTTVVNAAGVRLITPCSTATRNGTCRSSILAAR